MNLKYLLFSIVLLGIAQSQAPMVSKISIQGNRVTMDFIIQRELQHSVGIPYDSTLASEDRNRLINLGIFSDVYYRIIPIEDLSVILEYEVVESKRFIGGPAPAYEEKTGWSITGGLIWKNFRGRNETLMGGVSFGGRNTYGFNYYNPWIGGDHISLSIEAGRNIQEHPFLPYEVRTNSFELNIGRYFGYSRKLNLGFELEQKSFVSDTQTYLYNYIAPQGSFRYDTRDLYEEPTRGIYIIQSFYTIIDLEGQRQTTTFWQSSYSLYKNLDDKPKHLILALNLSSRITLGYKDPIWTSYIGGSSTVRGWKIPNRELYNEGQHKYRFGQHNGLASVELRKTVIPRRATEFGTEFGLTIAWFIDAGISAGELGDFANQDPIFGTGISFQIPIAYVGIIRLEYGWGYQNGKNKDQAFHLGIQQKF